MKPFLSISFALLVTSGALGASQDFISFERGLADRDSQQLHEGRSYTNVNYEDLKIYFDEFCESRAEDHAVGVRVAFVGAIHLAESYRTCTSESCLNAVMNPYKPRGLLNIGPGRIDPLFVDLGERYEQIKRDSDFDRCERLSIFDNNFCLVGIYGTIRRVSFNAEIATGNASMFTEPRECVVDVESIVFGALQDRNRWILEGAVQGALDPFGNQTGFFRE
ncbi:MAG: hypothetical protein ACFE0P_04500 [Oceanicaulis sp.]